MTGLWDAKVDRVPILALTGQVQTQVLGPGAFQEVPLDQAFQPVAEWSQTVLSPDERHRARRAGDEARHRAARRRPPHLPGRGAGARRRRRPARPAPRRSGRRPPPSRRPRTSSPAPSALLGAAERPAIVVGNGARAVPRRGPRPRRAPRRPGDHDVQGQGHDPATTTRSPAACSAARGIPVGVADDARSRLPARARRVVLATTRRSPTWVPTIQVDLDRMMLGKFHPVEVPLWGDIGRTLDLLAAAPAGGRPTGPPRGASPPAGRGGAPRRPTRATLHRRTRAGCTPRSCSRRWARSTPDDAVIAVDVGNNTYSFGHFFECRGRQDVLMSGYLGSIGFALPAAIGASVAVRAPAGTPAARSCRSAATAGSGSTSPSSPRR